MYQQSINEWINSQSITQSFCQSVSKKADKHIKTSTQPASQIIYKEICHDRKLTLPNSRQLWHKQPTYLTCNYQQHKSLWSNPSILSPFDVKPPASHSFHLQTSCSARHHLNSKALFIDHNWTWFLLIVLTAFSTTTVFEWWRCTPPQASRSVVQK